MRRVVRSTPLGAGTGPAEDRTPRDRATARSSGAARRSSCSRSSAACPCPGGHELPGCMSRSPERRMQPLKLNRSTLTPGLEPSALRRPAPTSDRILVRVFDDLMHRRRHHRPVSELARRLNVHGWRGMRVPVVVFPGHFGMYLDSRTTARAARFLRCEGFVGRRVDDRDTPVANPSQGGLSGFGSVPTASFSSACRSRTARCASARRPPS